MADTRQIPGCPPGLSPAAAPVVASGLCDTATKPVQQSAYQSPGRPAFRRMSGRGSRRESLVSAERMSVQVARKVGDRGGADTAARTRSLIESHAHDERRIIRLGEASEP